MGRSKRLESAIGFDVASHANRNDLVGRTQTRSGIAALRLTYFASAADTAGRYGVTFDDVIRHLWRFRRTRGRVLLQTVRHLEDLVHTVACVNGYASAWSDLVDRHESALVRRCSERLGDMQAILLVRRMFAALREPDSPETLLDFVGDRPLRTWLAERVMAQLSTVWCATSARGGRPPIWRHGPLMVTTGHRPLPATASLQFPTELTRFGNQPPTPPRRPEAGAGP